MVKYARQAGGVVNFLLKYAKNTAENHKAMQAFFSSVSSWFSQGYGFTCPHGVIRAMLRKKSILEDCFKSLLYGTKTSVVMWTQGKTAAKPVLFLKTCCVMCLEPQSELLVHL